jgi:hypothetical protein
MASHARLARVLTILEKAPYNLPLTNVPAAFFKSPAFTFSLPPMNFAHKYVLFIKGDTLDDVAEEALHLVYVFVMRALQEHRSQGRNGQYESFAIELLALLQKYRHQYTTPSGAPSPD